MDNKFDAIVIGAGHAGCESALALARLGNKTLLLTLNLEAVAFLACNPSIGGTGKGQLVCEIDALGGEMGIVADKCMLQMKMLNASKGAAVFSLRAQEDKNAYHQTMKQVLENQKNLIFKQAEVSKILTENKLNTNYVIGVETVLGQKFFAPTVIVSTGVYLKSRIIIGEFTKNSGPNGFAPANELTKSLTDLGFEIRRFKTGTPARINGNSINFSSLEEQCGDITIKGFSSLSKNINSKEKSCFQTATNFQTHNVIRNNLHRAPMYTGIIEGVGPRYCPSIEDKIVRFPERNSHQIFLEPEGNETNEWYVQGVSTSLPVDVQDQLYHSIKGLENCQIMRDAYAIEYDCINSLDLFPNLESKKVEGLFFAGQVNGTSGYEEAAAQGLVAGINANQKINKKQPLILGRETSYIGVLIDDLVTKGTNEPYRMMTSRAEFRLWLRQDNADERLTDIGRKIGLVSDMRWKVFNNKCKALQKAREELKTTLPLKELKAYFQKIGESTLQTSIKVKSVLLRSNVSIFDLKKLFKLWKRVPSSILQTLETEVKYEGYIKQQKAEIAKVKLQENLKIPKEFDFSSQKNIRLEARQKLAKIQPLNIGQASRISGVSPADIAVLIATIKKLH
ncbi:MAG: tRNA uridine-5-carboxymethylaminomethyl(34) synthesis enzyme MnmG [Clostridia bacterium]